MVDSSQMDEKTLNTLEYFKILEQLADHTSFSASADLARATRPTNTLEEALLWQSQTREARRLLDVNLDVSVGGAHDIRPQVDLAAHGGTLPAEDLLAVKTTLIAARELARSFERQGEYYPRLTAIAEKLPPPPGLVDAISRAINERGEVMDTASDRLGNIRRDLKTSHDRLLSRLERLINDPHSNGMLQEGIITQRNGRYVIPLRAEFKGRIRSIVHDQSASGATLFVEPLAVVELNNQLRELELAERDEVLRILNDLSRQVGKFAADLETLVLALAELDLALARAKYAEELHATEPQLISIPEKPASTKPEIRLRLFNARHPLLDPECVVPIDVYLEGDTFSLVITGPNTGGKTVTLKTVGLLTLMAQSGMHIPVQSGSEISLFQAIYADIGDEQSIEQSLSTFSGHITNIIRILERADNRTMVLLDELGAGTDPQEGSALARAILSHLLEKKVTTLASTHYPELKAFAQATPGIINASVEFNLETLRPTYHLIIGLPGRSNALAIAERLGLPDTIIQAARSELNPEDLRVESLLDEIHRQRDLAREARAQADSAQQEAEKTRERLSQRLEKIEDERRAILENARTEAQEQTSDLENELEEVRRALSRARQPLEALKPIERTLEKVDEKNHQAVERRTPERSERQIAPKGPLRLGEKVRLRSLKMDGVITGISESDLEVQVGMLRVRARIGDILRAGELPQEEAAPAAAAVKTTSRKKTATNPNAPTPPPAESKPSSPFHPSPGMELDLRGQRVEDALSALERHIEAAYLSGLPFVRIIHGKGTGRLRQVVRQSLRESPHVSSWIVGQENEGGDGVTIARMIPD